jgi:hypothetical protein
VNTIKDLRCRHRAQAKIYSIKNYFNFEPGDVQAVQALELHSSFSSSKHASESIRFVELLQDLKKQGISCPSQSLDKAPEF